MPIPPRAEMPSLLQVSAILGHLTGRAAADEVGRFLTAEFPHWAELAVLRADPAGLDRVGGSADTTLGGAAAPDLLGAGARALATGRSQGPGPASEAAVPIRAGDRVAGVVTVRARSAGGLDASDVRLLEKVAARLGPLVAPPPG